MTRRKLDPSLSREELNAIRTPWPDVPEAFHFFICRFCGQRVDSRCLGDVIHHESAGHVRLLEPGKVAPQMPIAPMLPTLVDLPPNGEEWAHEIKFDGIRTQLHILDVGARMFGRDGQDDTDRYGPIIEAALYLPCETAIIDGEVIVQDEQGRSDVAALRDAVEDAPQRLLVMCFDLLELDGQDLRSKPIERRRELLAKLTARNGIANPIQFSADVPAFWPWSTTRAWRASSRRGWAVPMSAVAQRAGSKRNVMPNRSLSS